MSKASLSRLVVACAALAACSDGVTNAGPTAPTARASLGEAASEAGAWYTLDEPLDLVLASADANLQLLAAPLAASPQAASGGRASGHVGFNNGLPAIGLASERYSFTALSTDPATPFAAKGQYEMTLVTVTGVTNRIQGDVVCVGFAGNTARVAGQITRAWRNGVQIPIPARTHNVWVVVDNGKGSGTPDFVSPMGFQTAAVAATHCATGTPSIVFGNQEGDVQVQP